MFHVEPRKGGEKDVPRGTSEERVERMFRVEHRGERVERMFRVEHRRRYARECSTWNIGGDGLENVPRGTSGEREERMFHVEPWRR